MANRGVLLVLCLSALGTAQAAGHPNYEDDVKPVFARRCFGCHSAGEMRSGLNLETYSGVLKGGSSGDVVIAARAASSMLYRAVAREDGAPQMPLGQAKLPDAEIALIREWIEGGLLETAMSAPKGPVGPALEYHRSEVKQPAVMPEALGALELKEPARAHPVTALAASPWAPVVAIAGHERVYLYDLAKHSPAGELAFPEGVPYVLRFSRDGATLLAAGGRGVQLGKAALFDVRTGKRIATMGEERDIVLAADVTADGKLVALGGPGKTVKVYAVVDGKLKYEIKKHTDWITALEFSPDGSHLATGDRSGAIYLWEAATGGTVGALADHKDSITSLSWRGDGALLASGSEDGQIIVWNVSDGFPVATMAKAHLPKAAPGQYGTIPGGVLSVQFTSEGRIVSVGRDSTIRAWSADGKARGASAANDALLTKVAVSSDGKLTIAGDYNGKVIVWDGATTVVLRGGK
uniref:WD-40 repeat protein n=1 Tax=Solibacter usitatus (strain Ellin6076) TaxID=234267 RepID=Q01WH2_SOLUE